MSLVLAADYRVPDFDRWWAKLWGDLSQLPRLGAHHIVVYRSLEDTSRVFVTLGVRERGPVDALLRSPTWFAWFDSAGATFQGLANQYHNFFEQVSRLLKLT